MPRESGDPCTNINFIVDFEDIDVEGFCHISGLESLVEVDNDANDHNKKSGASSCGNIILRRAIDERQDLWNWYSSILSGKKVRRDGSIVILNEAHEEFLRIHIRQAWPCRWKLGALDTHHPEVLLEEIELVVESLHIG